MTLFESWPHNWFGVWKNSEADPFQVPLFDEIVDASWNPSDLGDIVAYLKDCPVSITSQSLSEPCPLCGEVLDDLTAQRSDGVWGWPSTLAHYVSKHHVRLPDRFAEHIRSNKYAVPTFPESQQGSDPEPSPNGPYEDPRPRSR
jgi:hypothetical protein